MDEQELLKNKKLAEWVGNIEHDWDGDFCDNCHESEWEFSDKPCVPDFHESLDACFYWLVPKAVKLLADSDLSTDKEGMVKLFDLWLEEFWTARQAPISLALALSLTIEKLIDEVARK